MKFASILAFCGVGHVLGKITLEVEFEGIPKKKKGWFLSKRTDGPDSKKLTGEYFFINEDATVVETELMTVNCDGREAALPKHNQHRLFGGLLENIKIVGIARPNTQKLEATEDFPSFAPGVVLVDPKCGNVDHEDFIRVVCENNRAIRIHKEIRIPEAINGQGRSVVFFLKAEILTNPPIIGTHMVRLSNLDEMADEMANARKLVAVVSDRHPKVFDKKSPHRLHVLPQKEDRDEEDRDVSLPALNKKATFYDSEGGIIDPRGPHSPPPFLAIRVTKSALQRRPGASVTFVPVQPRDGSHAIVEYRSGSWLGSEEAFLPEIRFYFFGDVPKARSPDSGPRSSFSGRRSPRTRSSQRRRALDLDD